MSSNTRSVGLNIKRRINELYSAVAPIKAAADSWNLTGADNLLPSDTAMKAAIEAFEALTISPLRLFEEIQELKTGAAEPPISGQVLIDWANITNKPLTFPCEGGNGTTAWADITDKPEEFQPSYHEHNPYGDFNPAVNFNTFLVHEPMGSMIAIFPAGVEEYPDIWKKCQGGTISRSTPAGMFLVGAGCPFGVGDGTTTVNVPNMAAPLTGFDYRMFIGVF